MLEKIKKVVEEIFPFNETINISIPEEQFGDLSTNVAMQLAGRLKKNPREIADQIVEKIRELEEVEEANVAGAGFINIRLKDYVLISQAQSTIRQTLNGQTIICEYSDMNAFKTAHVGHLYTTLVGNSVANLLEASGATVVRANFGGDVGLHVGKAMWAVMRQVKEDPARLTEISEQDRAAWVTERYVEGNEAYENDETAKAEIIEVNKKVYAVHENQDHESVFAQIYWECRQWSYNGFEQFYESLNLDKQADNTHFVYYPESTTAPLGVELVEKGLKQGVFVRSNGAVVYEGEKDGLHTRVFLTNSGLPTYESKDLGLAVRKWQDYHYDRNIIITANDITEYMKVVLRALSKLLPETDGKTVHLTHGLVKLAGGQKMSSRKGNVLLPQDVLNAAREASKQASGKNDERTVLGAVKYTFLKNRMGGDIIYDPAESVSIQGNSGPYLQYAHARAKSIVKKSKTTPFSDMLVYETKLEGSERTLVRKLNEYSGVVEQAALELAPHHVCTYLYELAQEFNRFYEQNKVIGSAQEASRVQLVGLYAKTLESGLSLLGIHAPDHM